MKENFQENKEAIKKVILSNANKTIEDYKNKNVNDFEVFDMGAWYKSDSADSQAPNRICFIAEIDENGKIINGEFTTLYNVSSKLTSKN